MTDVLQKRGEVRGVLLRLFDTWQVPRAPDQLELVSVKSLEQAGYRVLHLDELSGKEDKLNQLLKESFG